MAGSLQPTVCHDSLTCALTPVDTIIIKLTMTHRQCCGAMRDRRRDHGAARRQDPVACCQQTKATYLGPTRLRRLQCQRLGKAQFSNALALLTERWSIGLALPVGAKARAAGRLTASALPAASCTKQPNPLVGCHPYYRARHQFNGRIRCDRPVVWARGRAELNPDLLAFR